MLELAEELVGDGLERTRSQEFTMESSKLSTSTYHAGLCVLEFNSIDFCNDDMYSVQLLLNMCDK